MSKAAETTTPTTTNAPISVTIARPADLIPVSKIRAEATRASKIETPDHAKRSGEVLRRIRQRIRVIKDHYKKVRKPVNDAIAQLRTMEKDDLAPWLAADVLVADALKAWLKADAEAKEQQARANLAAATEKAAQERVTQVAEITAAARAAEDPAERKALRDQAKAVAAAPLLPVVAATAEPTKIEGISTPTRWHAEVRDFARLLVAVVAGTVSQKAVMPNQDWLDEQAVSLQKDLNYPGVEAVSETGISARSL